MQNIADFIDHTLLKPETSISMIEQHCTEALKYSFKTICVNPYWVSTAVELLKRSSVLVATVIGFPTGAIHPSCKLEEAYQAIEDGAAELDVVINIGALKSNHWHVVRQEIESIVAIQDGITIKVILETCLLSDEEKKIACRLAEEAGAHFVKTSTGFSHSGATLSDIALMRKNLSKKIGIKASGGIRNFQTALAMLAMGATRLGTSASVNILQQIKTQEHPF